MLRMLPMLSETLDEAPDWPAEDVCFLFMVGFFYDHFGQNLIIKILTIL